VDDKGKSAVVQASSFVTKILLLGTPWRWTASKGSGKMQDGRQFNSMAIFHENGMTQEVELAYV